MAAADTEQPQEAMVGEDGPDPEPLLSFREHMWDSFGKLWNERVEPSRKLLEDFTASIRDRIEVERVYATGLAKLTERLEPHIERGRVPPPIEAIVVNVKHRAEQSSWIADEMEQDVLTPIEAMLAQHAEVCKRVHADGQKLTKQLQETYKSYEQATARYVQACSDAEESAKECLHGVFLRPAERTKVAARSIMLARQATASEREYYKSVRSLNSSIDTHQRQLGNVLQALEAIEDKRGQCCQDTVMKLVVYESSWLRNMQYDLEGVISTANKHDPMDELQKYIKENQSTQALPVVSGPKHFWHLKAHSSSPVAPWPSSVAVQQGEAVHSERLNVIRPLLEELLTPATDGSGGTPSQPGESRPPDHELTELHRGLVEDGPQALSQGTSSIGTSSFSTSSFSLNAEPAPLWSNCATYRAALCTALKEALLGTAASGQSATATSASPTQRAATPGAVPHRSNSKGIMSESSCSQANMRTAAPPVRLGSSAFSAVVAIFMKALDGCMQENDVWNGRDLMVLAPRVTLESSEGNTENVLAKVFPHAIWGQKSFWEDMLLVSIAEAHALVAVGRRRDPPGTEHFDIAVTAFLQSYYVHYMRLFGIKQAEARDSIAKTLQKHSNILGNTVGTYQEMLMQKNASLPTRPTK